MAKKLGDQYIVGFPNLKVRGPVSPGPFGCCAYGSLGLRVLLAPQLVLSIRVCSETRRILITVTVQLTLTALIVVEVCLLYFSVGLALF